MGEEVRKPDYDLEQYWYQIKQSMINFYRDVPNLIRRPIEVWSNELNLLQLEKRYKQIEKSIYRIHILYMLDLVKAHHLYHAYLFHTNLNRWNSICIDPEHKFLLKMDLTNTQNDYEKDIHQKVYILFEFLLKTSTLEVDKYERYRHRIELLFEQVEVYVFFDEWQSLVELSIDIGKSSLLNLLRMNRDEVDKYLMKKYDLVISKDMKTDKILKKISLKTYID